MTGLFDSEAFEQMPGQMSMEQCLEMGEPLPPSANGFALQVNGHTLTAIWRAPFYVLVIGWQEDDEEPMLVHCETLEDARSVARCWQGETHVLNATFEQVA